MREYRALAFRLIDAREKSKISSLVKDTNDHLRLAEIRESDLDRLIVQGGTFALGDEAIGRWSFEVTHGSVPIMCYSLDSLGKDHFQTLCAVSYLLQQASRGTFHVLRLVPLTCDEWNLFGVHEPEFVGRIDGQYLVHSVLTPGSSSSLAELRRRVEAARVAGVFVDSCISIPDKRKSISRFLAAFEAAVK